MVYGKKVGFGSNLPYMPEFAQNCTHKHLRLSSEIYFSSKFRYKKIFKHECNKMTI